MSTPPNIPPGGMPPIPPYDPSTQWRVYSEQQRAEWRAQRDAWRTQRHMWKANYVSAYGPRVPSMVGPIILIAIGVIALLVMTGRISAGDFWNWYGRWWPLLLIVAGLAMLAEWGLDLRRATPIRRSGGFVGILIFLAFLGVSANGFNHASNWFDGWGHNGDDFFNAFGLPEHTSDLAPQSAQIPANADVVIDLPHGDLSVVGSDGSTIEVQSHAVAHASSDADASKVFTSIAPHLTVSGNSVLVRSEENGKGRVNLTVTVPKTARVTVNSTWDDVTAAGLSAGINVTARGDIHLNSITGPVEAHFTNGKHDEFSAHDITGDLALQGDLNDLTLSQIKGRVMQNGQLDGDVHIEDVSGQVHLHTSVTELQLESLPGELTLNSDDLRVTEAQGQVRVTTHAKDIDLSQIYGDTFVDNRDGSISVAPAGPYAIEARDGKGDVNITIPPDGAGTVDGHTRNGDIVTDFGLTISGEENKSVSGKIGSGGPKIELSTDNGDLHIKKGPAYPPKPPVAQATPAAPKPPPSGSTPHLKSPKTLPAEPVTQ